MPILIGNSLFIKELPVDYSGKLLDLAPYIVPLNTFLISGGRMYKKQLQTPHYETETPKVST